MLNLNWKTLQNGAVVLLALYILPKILPWLLLFAVVGGSSLASPSAKASQQRRKAVSVSPSLSLPLIRSNQSAITLSLS